jgi:hypothetical protein
MIRIGVALAVVLLLVQVGVLAVGVPVSDYFGFVDSAFGTTVLSRGLGDTYSLLDSAFGTTVLSRGPGASYSFSDTPFCFVNSKPCSPLVFSCATQLSETSHFCSLVGTPKNDTFLINLCELSNGICQLSGNDIISAVGGGGADTFYITNGPGNDTYSIIAGSGNATFYVDACDGANADNFSLSFQAGVCTSVLLPPTSVNLYTLLGGGNANSPNTFVILDGPGTNTYVLTGGAGPDSFTIYGGEENDTYAIVGGTGSTVNILGGNGTETYSMICGSESILNITSGAGQERFGIIAGPESVISFDLSANSSTPANDVYNIVF